MKGTFIHTVQEPHDKSWYGVNSSRRTSIHRDSIRVLPHGWAASIPPSGGVHWPNSLDALSPEQRITVGLCTAEGNVNDLELARLGLRLTCNEVVKEWIDLRAVAVRGIRSPGFDHVANVLTGGGVAQAEVSQYEASATSTVIAVFAFDWQAPIVNRETSLQIEATASFPDNLTIRIGSTSIKLRPWDDWHSDSVPDVDAMPQRYRDFRERAQPGHLLSMLKTPAPIELDSAPFSFSFFARAFAMYPAAREAAVDALSSLDARTRWRFLTVLRLAGEDIGELGANPAQESNLPLPRQVYPLTDPRQFDIFDFKLSGPRGTAETVTHLATQMDECWGKLGSYWGRALPASGGRFVGRCK